MSASYRSPSRGRKRSKKKKKPRCRLRKRVGHLLPTPASANTTGICEICNMWLEEYEKATQYDVLLPQLQQQVESERQRASALEDQLRAANEKNNSLQRELRNRDHEELKNSRHIKQLQHERESMAGDNNDLRREIKSLHGTIESLKKAYTQLVEEREMNRSNWKETAIDNEQLSSRVNLLKEEVRRLKQDIADHNKAVLEDRMERESLVKKLAAADDTIAELKRTKSICSKCLIGAAECPTCRRVCDDIWDTEDTNNMLFTPRPPSAFARTEGGLARPGSVSTRKRARPQTAGRLGRSPARGRPATAKTRAKPSWAVSVAPRGGLPRGGGGSAGGGLTDEDEEPMTDEERLKWKAMEHARLANTVGTAKSVLSRARMNSMSRDF